MGGSLSAAGSALLHARPGVHGPELPSSSASSSRPPSGAGGGLGDPWLSGGGGGSHPGSSSPSTPPRWSAPERRAAAKGAAAGAAGGALALAALLLLVAGRGGGATAPPAASAHPARRLADGGPGSEGLGLWGGAAEGRGGAAAGGPPAAARLPGRLPAAASDPRPSSSPPPAPRPPVLISYAYFEKDATQAANLAFFIAAGLGQGGAAGVAGGGREEARGGGQARRADTILTVSGPACTPCAGLARGLARLPLPPSLSAALITSAWGRTGLTLLHRAANEGMDFGAHNASLAWAAADASGGRRAAASPPSAAPPALAAAAAARFGYAFFIFLNSSVRGPFVPAYLPAGWHWSRAFTDGLARDGCAGGQEEGGEDALPPSTSSSCLPPAEAPPPSAAAALVAASLTCLPPEDAGGPGPRAESWAFALSAGGLAAAEGAGVFAVRACKLCADPATGIVVGGEYGLSSTLLAAGARLATLQARYARGTDWADPAHWGCNACAHPSRHGTYGPGLALHPFETLFVKASWGVGAPFLEAYTAWATGHARGDDPGTGAVRVEETGGSGGGGAEGEGSGGPTSPWARGPAAACDLPLYRYGVSPAATAPAATAGLAASFLPPGLAGLVGSDGGGGGADR